MKRLPLVILAGVVLAGFLVGRGCQGRLEQKLPPPVVHVFSGPETLELLVLAPEPLAAEEEPAGEHGAVRGHVVLGRAQVADAEERAEIASLVAQGVLDAKGVQRATCFRPRRALAATRGAHRVEVLISFDCRAIDVVLDGEPALELPTAATHAAELDLAFRRQGLDVTGR